MHILTLPNYSLSAHTNSCLPFTPKHSSILFQPFCPSIPISSHCVFISLFVDCVSEWLLEQITVGIL